MTAQTTIQGAAKGPTNIADLIAALTSGKGGKTGGTTGVEGAFAAFLQQLDTPSAGNAKTASEGQRVALRSQGATDSSATAISVEDILKALTSSTNGDGPEDTTLTRLIARLTGSAAAGREIPTSTVDAAADNGKAGARPGAPEAVATKELPEELAALGLLLTRSAQASQTGLETANSDGAAPRALQGAHKDAGMPAAESLREAFANLPADIKAKIESVMRGDAAPASPRQHSVPHAASGINPGAAGNAGADGNKSGEDAANHRRDANNPPPANADKARPAAANRNVDTAVRAAAQPPSSAVQSLLRGADIRIQSGRNAPAQPGLMTAQTTAAMFAAGAAEAAKTAGSPSTGHGKTAQAAASQATTGQSSPGPVPPGQTPPPPGPTATGGIKTFHVSGAMDDLHTETDPALANGLGTQSHTPGAEQFDTAIAKIARAPMTPQAPPQQVAMHITKAVEQGLNRFFIQLEPAEMGKVEVDLEVGSNGRVHAAVKADSPETLDLLQRDSRQLMKALEDAGLKPDSGSLDFSLQQETQDDTPAGGGNPKNAGRVESFSGDDGASDAPHAHRRHDGDLDLWI